MRGGTTLTTRKVDHAKLFKLFGFLWSTLTGSVKESFLVYADATEQLVSIRQAASAAGLMNAKALVTGANVWLVRWKGLGVAATARVPVRAEPDIAGAQSALSGVKDARAKVVQANLTALVELYKTKARLHAEVGQMDCVANRAGLLDSFAARPVRDGRLLRETELVEEYYRGLAAEMSSCLTAVEAVQRFVSGRRLTDAVSTASEKANAKVEELCAAVESYADNGGSKDDEAVVKKRIGTAIAALPCEFARRCGRKFATALVRGR